MFLAETEDFEFVLGGQDCAHGVGRVVDQDELGPGIHQFLKLVDLNLVARLFQPISASFSSKGSRDSSHQRKPRRRQKDIIPRVSQCQQAKDQSQRSSMSESDFILGQGKPLCGVHSGQELASCRGALGIGVIVF
jgi:hypothetical protein